MTEREYRQDDRNEGYCPVCANPLSGLTVNARGYCEQHGWQWAEWRGIEPDGYRISEAGIVPTSR